VGQAPSGERHVVSRESVAALLNPASIALVGATENSAWSQALIANLRSLGYQGRWHLVNPRYESQFGEPCHPSVEAIGQPVDCAYVMTSNAIVPGVMEDCARAGVRSAVLLTADYAEAGPAGVLREAELIEQSRRLGMTIQGPNCLGYVNYRAGLGAYGLPLSGPLQAGPIGLLTQSGAMLLHLHRLAQSRAIGLSHIISSGNEAMLDATDFLGHLLDDAETRVLGALMEGIRRPAAFLSIAERALAAGKPLVVLKVGSSPAGARSASAHTGALAVADRVVDAVFRQYGVVRVESMEELIETCALLAQERPRGRRTALLTASGGACGMLADRALETRLEIPDFEVRTKAALKEILPTFGTPQNPLDTTGLIVLDMTLLPRCLDAIGTDPGFDSVLICWDAPREPGLNPERTEARLKALADAVDACPLPCFITSYVTGELTEYGRESVRRHGLHFANGMPLAVKALDSAVGWVEARQRATEAAGRPAVSPPAPIEGSGTLSEVASKALLRGHGIPVTREVLAQDSAAAVAAFSTLSPPVVVKVVSAALPHKSEAGAVRVGVTSAAEVALAHDAVLAAARAFRPGLAVDGVLIAEQVVDGVELIAGAFCDPQFGPMVLVGAGGVLVEVMQDVALRRAPITEDEAMEMLTELRSSAVLDGVRGRPAADRRAAAQVLVALGRLALGMGRGEVDVNPLFVRPVGRGAVAADALVIFD